MCTQTTVRSTKPNLQLSRRRPKSSDPSSSYRTLGKIVSYLRHSALKGILTAVSCVVQMVDDVGNGADKGITEVWRIAAMDGNVEEEGSKTQ